MSGSQLITVTELNALLSDPKLVLLDIRYNLTDAAYGAPLMRQVTFREPALPISKPTLQGSARAATAALRCLIPDASA